MLTFTGDVWVATSEGSAIVRWDIPNFSDNVGVEKVINKGGLRPEQALQWGTYDVAYVAYDGAGNTAQCDFKIYVLTKTINRFKFKLTSVTRRGWNLGAPLCARHILRKLHFFSQVL